MCNLHWCYTFCTGVTLFAMVLHLNCTALSQSEASNFFMCIIITVILCKAGPFDFEGDRYDTETLTYAAW